MARQPAISSSISFQPLFNRAGGRTSNVGLKTMKRTLILVVAGLLALVSACATRTGTPAWVQEAERSGDRRRFDSYCFKITSGTDFSDVVPLRDLDASKISSAMRSELEALAENELARRRENEEEGITEYFPNLRGAYLVTLGCRDYSSGSYVSFLIRLDEAGSPLSHDAETIPATLRFLRGLIRA